jgi:hypothetical protein
MVQNLVELRVMAINTAKDYAKNVDTLIEEARKIEEYIQGDAIIPNVVEDPTKIWFKTFSEMQKNMQPLPPLPEIKVKKTKKKNKPE